MALPKAVLCQLADAADDEEAQLRSVGFATATVSWRELDSQQNGWIQLLPVLDDPSVSAWVITGDPADFNSAVRGKISLLSLALRREKPLLIALRLRSNEQFTDVPPAMAHIRIFSPSEPFAAKLMANRLRPQPAPGLPFVCRPHLDPLLGLWLEVAPPAENPQTGFLSGVFGAEVTAFGVGPSGAVPEKSTLFYPQLGIKGDIGGRVFSACAARNSVGEGNSCYMRIDGFPEGVFLAPHDVSEQGETPLLAVEFV